MIHRSCTIAAAIMILLILPASQSAGAAAPDSIPFISSRNRVILPVTIGGSRELMILLDTGMHFDGMLLYNPRLRDEIEMPAAAIEVQVGGAGDGPPNMALMADSIDIRSGGMTFAYQSVIMLKTDRMKGFPSDGVIGYSLFGHHTVEIDYDRSVLILHDPDDFRSDPSFEMIPMTFKENNIPWVECAIDTRGEGEVPVSMYIDLASGESIEMLTRIIKKFKLPDGLTDVYLGRGLSGDIHGQTGTVAAFRIGTFTLKNILTAFAPAETRSKQDGADGVIGNGLLQRFHVVFDYRESRLYLKPNSAFEKPFDPPHGD